MKKSSIILLLSLLHGALLAQQKIAVKGVLTDSFKKQEVSNATISLVRVKDSALIAFTRSDDAGKFNFNNIVPGEHHMLIITSYGKILQLKQMIMSQIWARSS